MYVHSKRMTTSTDTSPRTCNATYVEMIINLQIYEMSKLFELIGFQFLSNVRAYDINMDQFTSIRMMQNVESKCARKKK